jgi:hypothetical protein
MAVTGTALSQFAATTSSQLAGVISDETGSGSLVFATSPTLVTPILGTPQSGTLTNATGLPIVAGTTGTLSVARGGTGTATPALVQGANITITGTWPNQTIAASAPGTGTVTSVGGTGTVNGITLTGTVTSTGNLTLGGTLSNVSLTTQVTGTLPVANGGTGITSFGAGVATWLGTPSSANLAAAVTDETGSGALVFATSPTLVTPALGTPSSGTLTNATGLPIVAGTTGTLSVARGGTGDTTYTNGQLLIGNTTGNTLAKATLTQGTGITITNGAGAITIAATNNGTVTSVGGTGTVNGITLTGTVTSTGNLTLGGTLSGVNLTSQVTGTLPIANGGTGTTSTTFANLTTNVTGTLPVANGGTGITSFGSGVATWLGTPSSANLAAAVTDETGSGALVFATSPTLVTPVLGTPTSGTLSGCTVDGTNAVGFRTIPQNSQSTAYTLVLADSGKHIFHPSADTTARTFTIPANSSVAYPVGTAITFINQNGAGVITIAITSDTMRLSPAGTTGSRTLAANGSATAIKVTATEWLISGSGLT